MTSLVRARALHEAIWSAVCLAVAVPLWVKGDRHLALFLAVGMLWFGYMAYSLLGGSRQWPPRAPSKWMLADYAGRTLIFGVGAALCFAYAYTTNLVGLAAVLFAIALGSAVMTWALLRFDRAI